MQRCSSMKRLAAVALLVIGLTLAASLAHAAGGPGGTVGGYPTAANRGVTQVPSPPL
jgi:hypothetical protein